MLRLCGAYLDQTSAPLCPLSKNTVDRRWWHFAISLQKMYGLYGREHNTVDLSGVDVTMQDNEQTREDRALSQWTVGRLSEPFSANLHILLHLVKGWGVKVDVHHLQIQALFLGWNKKWKSYIQLNITHCSFGLVQQSGCIEDSVPIDLCISHTLASSSLAFLHRFVPSHLFPPYKRWVQT